MFGWKPQLAQAQVTVLKSDSIDGWSIYFGSLRTNSNFGPCCYGAFIVYRGNDCIGFYWGLIDHAPQDNGVLCQSCTGRFVLILKIVSDHNGLHFLPTQVVSQNTTRSLSR